jgi:hypothetical protein
MHGKPCMDFASSVKQFLAASSVVATVPLIQLGSGRICCQILSINVQMLQTTSCWLCMFGLFQENGPVCGIHLFLDSFCSGD